MVTRDNNIFRGLVLTVLSLAVLAVFGLAIGEPTGPDSLTPVQSSRFTTVAEKQLEAQAGNVTEVTISAQSATKAWQGYFGNVSGTVTLEDSSGSIFYDWTANEPEGEIYASTNSTITWTNVRCFNFSAGSGERNLTTEEARYGMDPDDVDGIDETFNRTTHDQFFVGTVEIVANTCRSTNVFVNSAPETDNFQNVLLIDPDGNSLIFTTIIENRDAANDTDKAGYDNTLTDFQLLVAEDEHNSTVAGSTTYYFWVEIE